MKHRNMNRNLTVYHARRPMYPNAADAGYFTRKALDILTAVVSSMGLITAMVVLVSFA